MAIDYNNLVLCLVASLSLHHLINQMFKFFGLCRSDGIKNRISALDLVTGKNENKIRNIELYI
jgi:hypothetical protein